MAGKFSEFGKKFSEGSKNAMNKTKDMAGLAKIKVKLSDEENTLENLFGELGEEYFRRFGDSPDAELKDICNLIRSSKDKIKELEGEIKNIKGIRICKNCGEDVNPGDSFCKKCGAKV